MEKTLLGEELFSEMCVSAAMLPSLLSLEIRLSSFVGVGDETSKLHFLEPNGEYLSKLSLDLDRGVGVVIKPENKIQNIA